MAYYVGTKPKNQDVERVFYLVLNPRFKGSRKACKYCEKEMDANTTYLQKHLDGCKAFKNNKPPTIDPIGSPTSNLI